MRKPMIPTTAPNNNLSSGSSSSSSRRRSMPKPTPCCSKVGLKRGPWTPEEDRILSEYVRKEGEGRWRTLPKRAGLVRCGKSCRLRWMNYLRPSIKHGDIAPDEEDLIIRLHRLLGNRWSLIAGRIPGRTDNEIKNYWNTHLSKKLISQGIDPRTHKPLMTSTNPNLKPAAQYNHNFQIPSALPAAPQSNDPISISLFAEKMNATGNSIIPNNDCVNDYFCGTNIDHEQGWQNSADMLLDGNDNSGGGDVGIDCSNDDDFSSFLDSLFDVDMFSQQERQHLQQQQQINGFGSDVNDKDNNVNLIMTTSAGFGVSSIQGDSISSADALNEDVNRQFV